MELIARLQEVASKNALFGKNLHVFAECTSTNDIALELLKTGAPHGTLVLSTKQTKGKGRAGRSWITDSGSLAISLIVKPELKVAHAPRLTLLIAHGILNALNALKISAKVKWPNDILINGKKICGILVEAILNGTNIEGAVIGIGINITRSNLDISTAGFLSDIMPISMEESLEAILDSFQNVILQISNEQAWETCLNNIQQCSATVGREIEFAGEHGLTRGTAIGLNYDGSLLVELPNRTLKSIYVGDISIANNDRNHVSIYAQSI